MILVPAVPERSTRSVAERETEISGNRANRFPENRDPAAPEQILPENQFPIARSSISRSAGMSCFFLERMSFSMYTPGSTRGQVI